MIFRDRAVPPVNPSVSFGEAHQPSVDQPADALGGTNPETPVGRCQQRPDFIVGPLVARRRFPTRESHAVKTPQTISRSKPKISVSGLCRGGNGRKVDALLLGPTGVQ